MAYYINIPVFLVLIVFTIATISYSDENNVQVTLLNRCSGFTDNRNTTSDDILINIPGNLTDAYSNRTVDFKIKKTIHDLECKNSFLQTVTWENGTDLISVKSGKRGVRLRYSGKDSSHFTEEGYYHDEGIYFHKNDYCVNSVSETEIELRLCNITCDEKTCIPKCCGPDEILTYWTFVCRKINEREKKWRPKIYHSDYPHHEVSNANDDKKVQFHRKRLHCDEFHRWPLSNTIGAKKRNVSDPRTPWRLTRDGRVVYFSIFRTWDPLPRGQYCIDGFANWGHGGDGNFTGLDSHSVLLHCPESNSTNELPFEPWKAWTYFNVLNVSSIFLLLTAFVHLLLFDKQHLHGLTVLNHSISMFCMYVLCAIAHFVSLYPNLGGGAGSPFCFTVAFMAHYFFVTSFTWLTIMNFDLWLTFRSMRPVSKMSKRMRRFRLYFVIGWLSPALLISSFIAMDKAYIETVEIVKIPEYGVRSCFVATSARGYYMYSLVAIALFFNTVLVLWTFYIFYEFRMQNANTFTTRRAKSDKYSVRLFTKLFFVMGVAWFVELLSWYYNGEKKPWPVVALECLVMYFQSFIVFFIFCVNRRTLKQLEDKYPCLKAFIGPIRTLNWFKYSDAEGLEMTTPGSTPRKLSLSATANSRIDSTLPRKTSSSSIRSGSSGKYVVNGKLERMESINLDSECENVTKESSSNATQIQHAPDLISNT